MGVPPFTGKGGCRAPLPLYRFASAEVHRTGVPGPIGSPGRPDRRAGVGYPAEVPQGRDRDTDVKRGPSGPRYF